MTHADAIKARIGAPCNPFNVVGWHGTSVDALVGAAATGRLPRSATSGGRFFICRAIVNGSFRPEARDDAEDYARQSAVLHRVASHLGVEVQMVWLAWATNPRAGLVEIDGLSAADVAGIRTACAEASAQGWRGVLLTIPRKVLPEGFTWTSEEVEPHELFVDFPGGFRVEWIASIRPLSDVDSRALVKALR